MKAGPITLALALDGVRQYHVPLFQRPYTWKERNWNELWTDLMETLDAPSGRKHFFGAIVTKSETVPQSSLTRYLLIDGQQRLTTVFVLLAALRDEAQRRAQEQIIGDIEHEQLFNYRRQGAEFFKLWPTRDDRAAFEAVLRGQNDGSGHPLTMARDFFKRKIERAGAPDVNILKDALLSRFEIVAVQLEGSDDPYRIFESLNAKGERLTEADLIRNYFLMRVEPEAQEELYTRLWQPMQEALGEKLSEFVRHFLSKDGDVISRGDVYYTVRGIVQDFETPQAVAGYLQEVARYARHYALLLDPSRECDPMVRASLDRLKRIQVTVAHPFLLHIFESRERGDLNGKAVQEILETLENYILRRWVCGVPSFGLNKIFPSLWKDALAAVGSDLSALNDGVQMVLAAKSYPRDAEFRDKLETGALYGGGERIARVHVILERLEQSYSHKEAVPLKDLTIEHIMPRTLSEEWCKHLGENANQIHDLWLDTLGNLTLTGYNSELSNLDFDQKRQRLANSHLELNREVVTQTAWTEAHIAARGVALATRLLQIWPSFAPAGAEQGRRGTRGVTGTQPTELVILGERIPVASWRDVAQRTLEVVAEAAPEGFASLLEAHPNLLSATAHGFRERRALKNGVWMEANLDANTLYRLAERAAQTAEFATDDWWVEYRPY